MTPWRRITAACLVLLLGGCVSYRQMADPLERHLIARHPERALEELEQRKSWNSDRLLYALDRGALLRMTGDLAGSNQALEQAKQRMEKLEAVSLSAQAVSSTVSEGLGDYTGAPFEQVLAHVYKALNYLELGQPYQARVEALQLDVLLKDKDETWQLPLAYYVSGLVFEETGEPSDALIAYRRAYEHYQKQPSLVVPGRLKSDLLRLSAREGLEDEHRRYLAAFGQLAPRGDGGGEVVLFVYNGLLPRKHQRFIDVQNPQTGRFTRIATPYYETREPAAGGVRIRVEGAQAASERVDDIALHARAAQAAQIPAITARALARAVVKDKAAGKAQQNDPLVGLLVNVAGVILEQADTRAWYTLPQEVALAGIPLPPGRYDLNVEVLGKDGTVLAVRDYPGVEVVKGNRRYLSLYWPATRVVDWRSR